MVSWTVCSQSLSLKSLDFLFPHLDSLSCLLSLSSFWWGSKLVTGCRSIVSQCGSRLRISRTLLSKSCRSWVHLPVPHWSKTLFSLSPWEQTTISTITLWLHLQHHTSTTHKIFRTCSSALSNNSCSSVPETLESLHSSCLLSLEPYHTTVVPSSSSSSRSNFSSLFCHWSSRFDSSPLSDCLFGFKDFADADRVRCSQIRNLQCGSSRMYTIPYDHQQDHRRHMCTIGQYLSQWLQHCIEELNRSTQSPISTSKIHSCKCFQCAVESAQQSGHKW